jgi:hypothetical protein
VSSEKIEFYVKEGGGAVQYTVILPVWPQ